MAKTCLSCKDRKEINDPDPYDWFCSDDKAVVCTKMKVKINKDSKHTSDHCGFKIITCGCRPYRIKQEIKERGIPDWCPKRSK